jgi:hypothetical protein
MHRRRLRSEESFSKRSALFLCLLSLAARALIRLTDLFDSFDYSTVRTLRYQVRTGSLPEHGTSCCLHSYVPYITTAIMMAQYVTLKKVSFIAEEEAEGRLLAQLDVTGRWEVGFSFQDSIAFPRHLIVVLLYGS